MVNLVTACRDCNLGKGATVPSHVVEMPLVKLMWLFYVEQVASKDAVRAEAREQFDELFSAIPSWIRSLFSARVESLKREMPAAQG